ncbi:MAG: hypothetical protein GXO34_08855 [Deltaproteobacteria bacterium]|nr:hypothetical protein [Deltaproteobacteria bacterium]
MRTLFMQEDGRLKTGRLSLALFLVLILGLSALFYLQKPVDEAVVVVRHIFTAPTPQTETAPQKPAPVEKNVPPTPAAKVVKPAKPVAAKVETAAEKPRQKAAPVPEPTRKGRPEKKMLAASESRSRPATEAGSRAAKTVVEPETGSLKSDPAPSRESLAETAEKSVKDEKKALEKTAGQPTGVTGNNPASRVEKVQADVVPAKKLTSPAVADNRKLLQEEVVVDLQKKWRPAARPVDQATAVHLMSQAARQRLAADYSGAEVEKKTVAPPKVAQVARSGVAEGEKPVKSAARKLPKLKVTIPTAAKSPGRDQPAAVTVSKSEYLDLHRAWRKTGDGDKLNDRIIPLRIENLRSAYRFLQMKPVVIRADGSCVDLNDGSRIPPQSLDRFSATVIRVVDPWQKWGEELRRAGLRRGEKFEVRYYLYDFVRRSVYARANQAYDWARNRGLLDPSTKPSDIDVLGRAYVVKRDGGGSFGVFVPLRFTTRDGRTVKIDPQAFNHSPDVLALHRAGLI